MEENIYSHTLLNGQIVTGTAYSLAQLSAKFQVWARLYGLDDETSLACFIANNPAKHPLYFKDTNEVLKIAKRGFKKLEGLIIPDLSEISGSLRFAKLETSM